MIDDHVMTRVAELHDHIQAPSTPPQEDALRGARLVRRRRAVSLATAAVALLVTAGIAQTALSDPAGAPQPAGNPSPTPTGSASDEEWAPERIRAQGVPDARVPTAVRGLTTRSYVVCDGAPCDWPRDPAPQDVDRALEVVADGRAAVFDLAGTGNYAVNAFDDDSVLVADDPDDRLEPPGVEAPARYRLLSSDGTELVLRMEDDPAPASPGPGVVVHNVHWWAGGSGDALYRVDPDAATIRPLDLPHEVGGETGVRLWGPNADEYLWGVTDDCRVMWQTPDGAFDDRRLPCQGWGVSLHHSWFPQGWLRPGRMAVGVQLDVMVMYVSLDHGTTWRRLPLPPEVTADGQGPTHNATIRNALARLG